ncbi:uracil-DNA glycosylase [Notoacmeibacter ruber]|uniref:Uracil-DNA glycosylase n=1 Tax=Notoacmeibacter ruber TaxID=2670375 RepID=A0A3L7JGP5_9HYPH|nr:uracil-DNA glycosylase [Notoacmeibacter ruber]RLQ87652.1 uracil-DNA glycosylase [Notoacmeibacter ruber]
MNDRVQLDESWKAALSDQFAASYMASLKSFLKSEYSSGATIFPPTTDYFRALDLTPLKKVKVVILGQDPYHGDGQAHGLCFSVKPQVRTPPSLVNIYKELQSDLGIAPVRHGFLESWARQGVLLLNSVLTVRRGEAASHRGQGWERFTDAVIRQVNDLDHPVVFMLWGSYAQKKASFVDTERHLVLKAPHPSPLSAHNGFFGCRHFSKANEFLARTGQETIDWQLPASVDD